jgi:hypothetical protein
MTEIVGTDGEFTSDEISFQIRNVILQEVSRVLATANIPVLDMAANTKDLGKLVTTAIAPQIAEYGLILPEFYIENISLPEEVEKVLDKRTSTGLAGDLSKYMDFNAAESMVQPNSAAGAAISTGLGAAIGMEMANRGGPWQGIARSADLPPPLPGAAAPLWHIAENGAATGPFAQAALQEMAAARKVTATSLVWTAGQDGWKPAGDTALAGLLAQVPPPPPGA